MSEFSGKCDFYDHVKDCDIDSIVNAKIEVGDTPIKITQIKDCALYYPHIITCCCYIDGKANITLTSDAWFNIEENRCLNFDLETAKREYHRCKRKKEEFIVDDVYKKFSVIDL